MKEIPTPLTDDDEDRCEQCGMRLISTHLARSLEQDRAELIAGLTEALDLVPRISDDDPMAPALAQWCRGAKTVLERMN